jgi:hypothetical protein
MSELVSWEQTPAGVLRNGGYRPSDETLAKARALESEKRWAHAEWESRMDAADAQLAAEGKLIRPWREVHAQQRDLAAVHGQIEIIHLGHSTPPELRPLHAMAALSQIRSGIDAPGHRDPLIEEHAETVAERVREARARMDAINKRLPAGVEAL